MPETTWPGLEQAKAILGYLFVHGTEEQIIAAIDDLLGVAPTCADVCEMVEFVKEHGTAAQLVRACTVATNRGCTCDACTPAE